MFSKSKDLSQNVIKDYIYNFFSFMNLTSGIWMIYLAYKGLNLFEIGIMESIYHITSFSMEMPTGIIADLYGRKMSRVLGRLVSIVSILFLLGNSIEMYVISFILAAISNNLESGAGEALLYDSLKELNDEDRFIRINGKKGVIQQVAGAISLILGGYLATISYELVYIVAAVIGVITVLHSLTFVEPSIGKIDTKGSKLDLFKNQIVESFKILRNDRRIGFLIITIEVFSTFLTTEFFYIQNYYKMLGKNELQIGIVLAIGGVLAALIGSQAYRLERKFSFKSIINGLSILAIIAFWGVANKSFTIVAFISLFAIDSIFVVVICDYINKLIPSERRATILSLQSMMFSIFMIILFPIVGKIGDLFSLNTAFIIIAMVSTLVLIAIMYTVSTKWVDIKSE